MLSSIRWVIGLFALLTLLTGAESADLTTPYYAYRLGPNDVVRIQVFGEEDLTVESKVAGDGTINFPLLGPVAVAGNTPQQVQGYLTTRLAEGYVRSPRVTVLVVRYRNFYVSGEVKTPGGYPYEAGLTLQKAISIAGGFTDKAETRKIPVTRSSGDRTETVSLGVEAPVLPDDIIAVGHMQKFYVTGEVVHPGPYPYEEQLTVKKALSLAGGLTERADPGGIKVTRLKETGAVPLEGVVLPDDLIVVEGQHHKVYVSGEVRTPGSYPYKEGLTVQKALAMAGGLSEKAEKGGLKVVRRVEGREETVPVTLNAVLMADDTIVVPEGQRIYVSGEVRTPGRYLYEPGLTVQKVLSMAGGFTERADKTGIKVTRVNGAGVETVLLEADARILPDDLIVVAQAKKFYVNGEVRTPGSFVYEKGLTVHKAITLAGGFTDKAAKSSTKVLRMLNGKEQTIEISLEAQVLAEDIVVVPQRFF
jgi:protein involved in polysaccharide export with SLBB domain